MQEMVQHFDERLTASTGMQPALNNTRLVNEGSTAARRGRAAVCR
jgi:hypothetical protein